MSAADPQDWREVAAQVFALGKRLAPSKFPAAPDPDDEPSKAEFRELCSTWAVELEAVGLPWQVWPDAVRWWCRNADPQARWDVGQARRAALRIRDEWQGDRQRREVLERFRDQRIRAKAAAGSVPWDVTPAVAPGPAHGVRRRQSWREKMAAERKRLGRPDPQDRRDAVAAENAEVRARLDVTEDDPWPQVPEF